MFFGHCVTAYGTLADGVASVVMQGKASWALVGAALSSRRKSTYSQIAATRSAMGTACIFLSLFTVADGIVCSASRRFVAANPWKDDTSIKQ
ncbi:hypothetical protein [Sanguibacter keddieii]|uniref:hypothetical protein n=1 Tax=Sanguibacter keddieii TaxID=60920 RepID=UPI0039C8F124